MRSIRKSVLQNLDGLVQVERVLARHQLGELGVAVEELRVHRRQNATAAAPASIVVSIG